MSDSATVTLSPMTGGTSKASRIKLPYLVLGTVLLMLGTAFVHLAVISWRTKALASQMSATPIDFNLEKASLSQAVGQLQDQLRKRDPSFEACTFEVDVRSPDQYEITMSLTACPGGECLKYITQLSLTTYQLRPGKVVVSDLHSPTDLRDPIERASDATVDWFRSAWVWAKYKLGKEPAPPMDPFAPISSPPKSPFPF